MISILRNEQKCNRDLQERFEFFYNELVDHMIPEPHKEPKEVLKKFELANKGLLRTLESNQVKLEKKLIDRVEVDQVTIPKEHPKPFINKRKGFIQEEDMVRLKLRSNQVFRDLGPVVNNKYDRFIGEILDHESLKYCSARDKKFQYDMEAADKKKVDQ